MPRGSDDDEATRRPREAARSRQLGGEKKHSSARAASAGRASRQKPHASSTRKPTTERAAQLPSRSKPVAKGKQPEKKHASRDIAIETKSGLSTKEVEAVYAQIKRKTGEIKDLVESEFQWRIAARKYLLQSLHEQKQRLKIETSDDTIHKRTLLTTEIGRLDLMLEKDKKDKIDFDPNYFDGQMEYYFQLSDEVEKLDDKIENLRQQETAALNRYRHAIDEGHSAEDAIQECELKQREYAKVAGMDLEEVLRSIETRSRKR
jgi:hypothetical protein